MNWLWMGTALLLIFSAGFGCSILLGSRRRQLSAIELLALSWLLGTAFVSLAQFILGQIILGTSLRGAVASVCIGTGLLGLIRARREGVVGFKFPTGGLARCLLALLAGQMIFLFWLSTRQCFGWDAMSVWELKARLAFFNGGVPAASYFSGQTMEYSHREYPLFISLIESWVYGWIGGCDQSSVRGIFPLFYLSCVLLFGVGIARLAPNSPANYLGAGLLFFVPFLYLRDGGVLSGYADFPLGVFYLCSAYYLICYLRENVPGDLCLFLATSAVLPWIKQEGKILALCLVGLAVAGTWKRLGWRSLLLPLPAVLCIEAWKGYTLIHHAGLQDFVPLSPGFLFWHLDRCGPILRDTLSEFLNAEHWSILWPGMACVLLKLLLFPRDNSDRILAGVVILPLAIYPCVYLFSALPSYLAHLSLSLPRLVFQIVPLGIFTMGTAICSTRVKS